MANDQAVAFPDGYPLNPGHTLVIPREHVSNLFELDHDIRAAMWDLVYQVHERLSAEYAVDGFNVGVNVGSAAGQTVDHAHIHVIPRHKGDVDDPSGGVRWVIPRRAAYWQSD